MHYMFSSRYDPTVSYTYLDLFWNPGRQSHLDMVTQTKSIVFRTKVITYYDND